MDKETLSNYGWIVIAVLVLSVMIALATPFGSYIEQGVRSTTAGLFETSEKALNVVGMSAGDGSFENDSNSPTPKIEGSATFNGYYDIDTATFIEEPATLTWDELKAGKDAIEYSYDASVITDTNIGDGAFKNCCETLANIVLPDGITNIGMDAFNCCWYLTSITIPNSVTSIGSWSFEMCGIINITYIGTKTEWNNIDFGESWNLYCPEIMVTCTDGTIIVPANNG